jgi:plasmid stabilization system protein ParE
MQSVDRLELHPRSGRAVPELGQPSIREVIVRNYRIVYQLVGGEVFIPGCKVRCRSGASER